MRFRLHYSVLTSLPNGQLVPVIEVNPNVPILLVKGGKLFLYGGWANRWFSDGFTLDVGSIVGPPYAVMDVIPDSGPITGETLLDIHGIDFINTEDVMVRLRHQKV